MRKERLPYMILAIFSLTTGLMSGLQRIGWDLSIYNLSVDHGAIMVGSFIGTLISLEKVIPLRDRMLYTVPAVSGLSILLFFAGMPVYATACLLMASAGLTLLFFFYWMRERSIIYAMMSAGAICWFTGNLLLLTGHSYPISLPWWMAFALLIISAERVELMKFIPVSQMQKFQFVFVVLTFPIACIISFHGPGSYLAAFALIGSSVWLMRHDVVAISLKKELLQKYIGFALLSGYVSLLLCGVFLLLPDVLMGYDILVHSFFIGFVFSMILAHGPIILPGVLGISAKPFHPVFYGWLMLLHVSWIVRSIADLSFDMQSRKYSGILSAIAIIGYFASLIIISIRNHRAKII